MKKLVTTVAILVAFAFVGSSTAVTQMECGDRAVMERNLSAVHGEVLRGGGYDGAYVVTIWANAESGSWTVLLLMPNGMACVGAAGMNWRDADWENVTPEKDAS